MSNISYTSVPLDYFVAPVTFDPGGPTTMIGATVRIDAINLATKAKVAGTASVIDATTVRATFAAGSLPTGNYEIQAVADFGDIEQVISATLWVVKPGAAA